MSHYRYTLYIVRDPSLVSTRSPRGEFGRIYTACTVLRNWQINSKSREFKWREGCYGRSHVGHEQENRREVKRRLRHREARFEFEIEPETWHVARVSVYYKPGEKRTNEPESKATLREDYMRECTQRLENWPRKQSETSRKGCYLSTIAVPESTNQIASHETIFHIIYMGHSTPNRPDWNLTIFYYFFSFKYVIDGYKKLLTAIFIFFLKISLTDMVDIVALALRAVVDSFEIYTIIFFF